MKGSACEHGPVWTLGGVLRELPGMPMQLARVAGTVLGHPISNELRERVMLAVAAENRCRYCMAAHARFGAASGIPRPEVQGILNGAWEGGDPGERAALAYVRDLTRRGFASRDVALWAGLDGYFDPAQKDAIDASARVMNFANRAGNTFDAALALFKGC